MKKFFIIVCLFISMVIPVHAEVALDGTTGAFGQIDGPEYDIRAEYGRQAGANLFHSFSRFSIGAGETATFAGPASVRNIISRVTGGDLSRIDGKLRSAVFGADLYLMNPAGVVFGPDASLDISGSFYATTADYLRLGENERFYAMPVEGEVLSSAPPTAFGFLDETAAGITFEGKGGVTGEDRDGNPTGLTVLEGERITLIGGDIEIRGTYDENDKSPLGNLSAPEGRIEMAAVASPGEAVLTESGPDVSSFEKLGETRLSDYAGITTSGEGSGNIFIRSGEFFADNGAEITADTSGDKDGGVTDIQADTISLTRNSRIFSDTKGNGTSGSIFLRATGSVNISDSKVYADATGEGADTGSAGAVSVEAEQISLSYGGAVSSETYGKSSGGSVTLRAGDSVSISEGGKIFARTTGEETDTDAGAGGTILIQAKEVSLSGGGSEVSSDTYKDGRGGNITISGPGENLADSVRISDGSAIYAGTSGAGDGGTVSVETKNLFITEGGMIDSKSVTTEGESYAEGKGGSILVRASEGISLENAGNITTSTSGPGGAGTIRLETGRLDLGTDASISSASTSAHDGGDAGTVFISASNLVRLSDNSEITTLAEDAGKGGITVEAGDRVYVWDSRITTSIKKGGNDAGDISMNQDVLILNRSRIVANAWEGDGGNIRLIADPFIQSWESLVDASSQFGIDGTVYIESPEGDFASMVLLPANLLDVTRWMKTPCAARSEGNVSRFVIRGRDAAITTFDGWQTSPLIWFED
ncbi:filamentous hemagglutinin N-terminal domain-containing protein [Desulfobacterales bacterium HSG2]|nr:filamentous hemagglutinin N-terminal domain-containing protein [Desulfobacterales bacterium HSG2]